jgi:hypothetical protein
MHLRVINFTIRMDGSATYYSRIYIWGLDIVVDSYTKFMACISVYEGIVELSKTLYEMSGLV